MKAHHRQIRRLSRWVCRSPLFVASFVSFFILVMIGIFCKIQSNNSLLGHLVSKGDSAAEQFIKKIEVEMSRRRKSVDAVCSRERLGRFAIKGQRSKIRHPPVPNYEAFFFNTKDKFAWCPVYKAASTSWLYNLCILAGISNDYLQISKTHISKIARKYYPSLEFEDGEKAMNETKLTFFIVRHPFERLLSAYRDKLENKNVGKEHGTEFYYKKYGKRIVDKYRKPSLTYTEGKNHFPNRYLHIIETKANITTNNESSEKESIAPDGSEPTFAEFLRYLTDLNLNIHADDHWIPYYLYCTPCLIPYDIIAKFETLDEDQKYIITKAKLEDRIQPTWKHLTKGKQTSKVTEKYFSTISKELLIRVYNRYRLDFQMFEYDINEYLDYVQ